MPTVHTITPSELHAQAKKAFKRYDDALRSGDEGEAADALERYQALTEETRLLRFQSASQQFELCPPRGQGVVARG